jgi:L-rhamnose mutarotase
MKRICFLLHVRPERLAEYRRRHQEVWPEMRQALSETGWHNYSIFAREDGLLVGYLETTDFQAALDGMAALEVNSRWQAQMQEFFEAGRPDEHMVPLPEIFHLD